MVKTWRRDVGSPESCRCKWVTMQPNECKYMQNERIKWKEKFKINGRKSTMDKTVVIIVLPQACILCAPKTELKLKQSSKASSVSFIRFFPFSFAFVRFQMDDFVLLLAIFSFFLFSSLSLTAHPVNRSNNSCDCWANTFTFEILQTHDDIVVAWIILLFSTRNFFFLF